MRSLFLPQRYLAWLHVFFLVNLSCAAWPLPESCSTMFCKPFCDLCMYRITEGDRGVAHCTGRKEGFCRSGIISAAPMSPVESISLYSYFFSERTVKERIAEFPLHKITSARLEEGISLIIFGCARASHQSCFYYAALEDFARMDYCRNTASLGQVSGQVTLSR